jgi:hypothetical protein
MRLERGANLMAVQTAAIGFSPHSGWAAMIVLNSSAAGLRVLSRSRVDLIEAHDPESRQPYHAVEFLCVEEATGRLDGYMAVARTLAQSAIQAQIQDLKQRGYQLTSIGIVDSASRKPGSLSSILASHALIHAADGDHFRNALSAAAELLGVRVIRTQGRTLQDQATECLRLPKSRVLDTVNKLGRQVGPPWGADQKQAALLAWILLKSPSRGS